MECHNKAGSKICKFRNQGMEQRETNDAFCQCKEDWCKHILWGNFEAGTLWSHS